MQSVDPGVLSHSYCFSFTPSDLAKKLYYYPTWCGHYFCNSDYFMRRESYPYLLLVYVIDGQFNLEYQNQTLVAKSGEALLIDCQKPHYYHASEGLEFLYIHFDGGNAHELCQQIFETHGYLFNNKASLQVGQMLHDLAEECNKDHVICAPSFSLLIYQFMMALSTSPTESEKLRVAVIRAINYIRRNVDRKITLAELANHANLSRYYFSHLFKAETGYSPQEYIISAKLDKAKVMLKSSAYSISEISYQVGYDNPGSFINLFCKKIGMSPTEFRMK